MILDDVHAPPRLIHLGFQSGVKSLRRYLRGLQSHGVNHVALNLRLIQANVETTLKQRADNLLPKLANKGTDDVEDHSRHRIY